MQTLKYFGSIQVIIIMSVYLLISPGCKEDKKTSCDPDIYEENESLGAAVSLGSLEEESGSFTARISSEDDLDFYTITATEGEHIGIPLSAQYFRVTFNLIPPPGKDYDLYIYNETGTLIGQSNNRGDTEEDIELDWQGTVGFDDSKPFGIEVRPYNGDWDCQDYDLTINMLYSDSPW